MVQGESERVHIAIPYITIVPGGYLKVTAKLHCLLSLGGNEQSVILSTHRSEHHVHEAVDIELSGIPESVQQCNSAAQSHSCSEI